MDSALQLKIYVDSGQTITIDDALTQLNESDLVAELTSDLIHKPLFYVWRIIALSEIPFAQYLPYTQKLIDIIYDRLATDFGFSLSGDQKDFLPCYNAMITTALCRLGRHKDKEVKTAINWIVKHQPLKRGVQVEIEGFNFDRYGGCFKSTPCYIGVAKSVMALFEYYKASNDQNVKAKLDQGFEYMLEHGFIYRLYSDGFVTSHVADLSFPESYHLNVVELLRLASQAGLMADSRLQPMVEYVKSKQKPNGEWKVNHRYKAEGYQVFDKPRTRADWLTYIVSQSLEVSS